VKGDFIDVCPTNLTGVQRASPLCRESEGVPQVFFNIPQEWGNKRVESGSMTSLGAMWDRCRCSP
jgi:hypothetical protein